MIKIVSCSLRSLGKYEVVDATDESARFAVAVAAERDFSEESEYIVLLDGVGSISVGFTLLRLIVETDALRRLALLGVTPEIRPLIDAWEAARLDDLVCANRLIISSKDSAGYVQELAMSWKNEATKITRTNGRRFGPTN